VQSPPACWTYAPGSNASARTGAGHNGLAEVAGKARRQRQDRDARGRHELIEHIRRIGASGLGVPGQEQVGRARGLRQKIAPITLGLLPDGAGPFAADAPKNRLDALCGLPICLALRFEELRPDIGRGVPIRGRDEGRWHHVHADQHGIEAVRETPRNLQARLEPAVVSKLDEDRTATHG